MHIAFCIYDDRDDDDVVAHAESYQSFLLLGDRMIFKFQMVKKWGHLSVSIKLLIEKHPNAMSGELNVARRGRKKF